MSTRTLMLEAAQAGQRFRLDLEDTRARRGGEAAVYPYPCDPRFVLKIYHKPEDARARASKLRSMIASPPVDPMRSKGHVSIAWPTDLVYEAGQRQRVRGFLMPAIASRSLEPHELYNPAVRCQKAPKVDYSFLLRTAANLSAVVRSIHGGGHVIGDLNQKNFLVYPTTGVALLDTDSFQIRGEDGVLHRCEVGVLDFQPPEMHGRDWRTINRTPAQDAFGLGILLFHVLFEGHHPFALVRPSGDRGSGQIAQNIQRGLFPYAGRLPGGYGPPKSAPPFEILAPEIRQLFIRCFVEGHGDPSRRPTAHQWNRCLRKASTDLVGCSRNNQHRYSRHLDHCPWCARAARLSFDSFPSREAIQNGSHLRSTTAEKTAGQSNSSSALSARKAIQGQRQVSGSPGNYPVAPSGTKGTKRSTHRPRRSALQLTLDFGRAIGGFAWAVAEWVAALLIAVGTWICTVLFYWAIAIVMSTLCGAAIFALLGIAWSLLTDILLPHLLWEADSWREVFDTAWSAGAFGMGLGFWIGVVLGGFAAVGAAFED